MSRRDYLEPLDNLLAIKREALKHNFPQVEIRLVTHEIYSWVPIGHCVVKTMEALMEKAEEALEFSTMLRVWVVPSTDRRFWNPALLYGDTPERKIVSL